MIIKTITYFAALLLITVAIVKGVESPGTITIDWFGYHIEANIMFAIIVVLLFVFFIQFTMHLLTMLGLLPSMIKYKAENKRLKLGLENIKAVALNLSLGNTVKAIKAAKKNHKILPDYPVFDEFLNLKSKNDVTNDLLDLKQAKNKVDEFLTNFNEEKALKIVENILEQHPDSTWAKTKKYHILLKLSEFEQALAMLEKLKKDNAISKQQYKLEASFIYYELALDNVDAVQSLKYAEKGMKLEANFIKVVDHCAIIFLEMQEYDKALKLMLSLAKNFNQQIATFDNFKAITENLTIEEQIKWLDKYAKINPSSIGCLVAKANSLMLQEKTEDAIELLRNAEQSKETLELLAMLYKQTQQDKKANECLEDAALLSYVDPADLIPEYQAWQQNNLVLDDNEDIETCALNASKKTESKMLGNG